MQKTVNATKQQAAQPGYRTTASMPAVSAVGAVRRGVKVGPIILILCLLLGIAAVLVVPMMVDGAAPASARIASQNMTATGASAPAVPYTTATEAAAALGLDARLPAALPGGFVQGVCQVVDGQLLEVYYTYGKAAVVLRVAAGNEEISGKNYEEAGYVYTATEEMDGVTRGYAGVSEKKLNVAVWVQDGLSYALVSDAGVEAAAFKALAEAAG